LSFRLADSAVTLLFASLIALPTPCHAFDAIIPFAAAIDYFHTDAAMLSAMRCRRVSTICCRLFLYALTLPFDTPLRFFLIYCLFFRPPFFAVILPPLLL